MTRKSGTCSVDRMFRALSGPTRLRILHLLKDNPGVCVCDLVSVIGAPQPNVSRHLACLRRVRLVQSRRDGLWSYYELTPARTAFHAKLLECLGSCFTDLPA